MNTRAPQQIHAFLTPDQIEDLQANYKGKPVSEALVALLLMAAGALVLAELVPDAKPKTKRRRRS